MIKDQPKNKTISPFWFSLFLFFCPIELSSYSYLKNYDWNTKSNKNFSLIKENPLEKRLNNEFSFYFPSKDSSFQESPEKARVENYLESISKEYALQEYINEINKSIKKLKPVSKSFPLFSFW